MVRINKGSNIYLLLQIMAGKDDRTGISQLKGAEDYVIWSSRLRNELNGKLIKDGGFDILQAEFLPAPGDRLPALERKKARLEALREEDKKTKNEIGRRLSDGLYLEFVKEEDTAYDLWKALEDRFAKRSLSTRILLQGKLQQIKYDNSSETLCQFSTRFDALLRELNQTGAKQDEESTIAYFLGAMPKEYGVLVTVIKTVANASLSSIKAQVEDFEVSNGMRKSDPNPTSKVTSLQAGASTSRFPYNCRYCNVRGHMERNCPEKRKERRGCRCCCPKKGRSRSPIRKKAYSHHSHGHGHGHGSRRREHRSGREERGRRGSRDYRRKQHRETAAAAEQCFECYSSSETESSDDSDSAEDNNKAEEPKYEFSEPKNKIQVPNKSHK